MQPSNVSLPLANKDPAKCHSNGQQSTDAAAVETGNPKVEANQYTPDPVAILRKRFEMFGQPLDSEEKIVSKAKPQCFKDRKTSNHQQKPSTGSQSSESSNEDTTGQFPDYLFLHEWERQYEENVPSYVSAGSRECLPKFSPAKVKNLGCSLKIVRMTRVCLMPSPVCCDPLSKPVSIVRGEGSHLTPMRYELTLDLLMDLQLRHMDKRRYQINLYRMVGAEHWSMVCPLVETDFVWKTSNKGERLAASARLTLHACGTYTIAAVPVNYPEDAVIPITGDSYALPRCCMDKDNTHGSPSCHAVADSEPHDPQALRERALDRRLSSEGDMGPATSRGHGYFSRPSEEE